MTCGGCSFARYCSKECQKLAWRLHKLECERLKQVYPNLPLTEVLFLSRVLDRKLYIEENGDKGAWESERKFKEFVFYIVMFGLFARKIDWKKLLPDFPTTISFQK